MYLSAKFWVYLGVRTCDIFLCFGAIVFLLYLCFASSVVLFVLCFTSPVSFTGSYTEDVPNFNDSFFSEHF